MRTAKWSRVGGAAGALFFVAAIVTFFLPSTPDDDTATAEIVSDIAADSAGLSAGVWLNGLMALLFLVFAVGLADRLAGVGGDQGAGMLVLLGGVGTSLVLIVSSMVTATLVEAAEDGREPEAVRALFELDETVFVGTAFTFAAFFGGAAVAGLAGRLPRWLAVSAAVLAAAMVIGSAGLLDLVNDGGPLGGVLFAAIMLGLLWVLAASVVMLRGAGDARQAGVPASSYASDADRLR